jgi:hypothetical protein
MLGRQAASPSEIGNGYEQMDKPDHVKTEIFEVGNTVSRAKAQRFGEIGIVLSCVLGVLAR